MAAVPPVVTDISGDGSVFLAVWTLTSADNVGVPIGDQFIQCSDRNVDMTGTFDSCTAVWEGSNGGTTYGTLNQVASGAAISKSAAAGPMQVLELPRYSRPRSSGGSGLQSVIVSCVARRQQQRNNR